MTFRLSARTRLGSSGALFVPAASAEPLSGRIVGIRDGDTVTLLDATRQPHTIRLTGIESPQRRQAFGNVSRQHLAGREVVAACPRADRYGPSLCKIKRGSVDANLAQIEAGMAWHYTAYAQDQPREDRARDAAAEDRARKEERGVWSDKAPQAPWEFRRAGRETATAR